MVASLLKPAIGFAALVCLAGPQATKAGERDPTALVAGTWVVLDAKAYVSTDRLPACADESVTLSVEAGNRLVRTEADGSLRFGTISNVRGNTFEAEYGDTAVYEYVVQSPRLIFENADNTITDRHERDIRYDVLTPAEKAHAAKHGGVRIVTETYKVGRQKIFLRCPDRPSFSGDASAERP